jgi:type II secretory ATPase GspE/PulE/Tfp pilus assembly ATPase PilB-like protein
MLDEPVAGPRETRAPVAEQPGDLNLDEPHPQGADGQAPAVGMCELIVREAIQLRASDIHIEPEAEGARVRLRVDGVLRSHLEIPRWLLRPLASRVKILAKLDIAQQRLPQDGRISAIFQGRRSNIRVSTLPTHFGEKIVLRLLGSVAVPGLDALGMAPDEVSMLSDAVAQPQGLVLVTGPTGAGKSTTLYSMLAQRTSSSLNIVTIEDPIEYQVDGITQVQVDAKTGLTFAKSLRAILRQDPDVILVGEIRDLETAEVAFQAALTGHLVLTTLHTNGTVAAMTRLLDLGLTPALITEATSVIVAQRLARRVCDACRTAYRPEADALRKLGVEADGEFSRGAGCAQCAQTGYAGRIGIFEILRMTRPLKAVVKRQGGDAEIAGTARAAVTRFLLEDAMIKVRAGLTTAEDVARVLRIERDDEMMLDIRKTRIAPADPSPLLES